MVVDQFPSAVRITFMMSFINIYLHLFAYVDRRRRRENTAPKAHRRTQRTAHDLVTPRIFFLVLWDRLWVAWRVP